MMNGQQKREGVRFAICQSVDTLQDAHIAEVKLERLHLTLDFIYFCTSLVEYLF